MKKIVGILILRLSKLTHTHTFLTPTSILWKNKTEQKNSLVSN